MIFFFAIRYVAASRLLIDLITFGVPVSAVGPMHSAHINNNIYYIHQPPMGLRNGDQVLIAHAQVHRHTLTHTHENHTHAIVAFWWFYVWCLFSPLPTMA